MTQPVALQSLFGQIGSSRELPRALLRRPAVAELGRMVSRCSRPRSSFALRSLFLASGSPAQYSAGGNSRAAWSRSVLSNSIQRPRICRARLRFSSSCSSRASRVLRWKRSSLPFDSGW